MAYTCLVPSLNSGSNGIQDYGEIECFRVSPSMCNFITQGLSITLIEVGNVFDTERVLCNQSTLSKHRQDIGETIRLCEVVDIL